MSNRPPEKTSCFTRSPKSVCKRVPFHSPNSTASCKGPCPTLWAPGPGRLIGHPGRTEQLSPAKQSKVQSSKGLKRSSLATSVPTFCAGLPERWASHFLRVFFFAAPKKKNTKTNRRFKRGPLKKAHSRLASGFHVLFLLVVRQAGRLKRKPCLHMQLGYLAQFPCA